jgi:hypothetical protein
MNRARLLELGFDLGVRAAGGRSQGAWFATAGDGAPVVLKWSPGATMAARYAALLPGLDDLRARGVPVPEYLYVGEFDSGTLSVQRRLPRAIGRHPVAGGRRADGRMYRRQGRRRGAAAGCRPAQVGRVHRPCPDGRSGRISDA